MHKVNDVLFDIILNNESCSRCKKIVQAGAVTGGVRFSSDPDARLIVCEECACKEAGIAYAPAQYPFAETVDD
jgi:hypothetical protein